MSEPEYTITRCGRGYVLSGPALNRPSSVFDTEAQAIALARHLIAAKSGYITGPDGERNLYQGSRHLNQDAAIQR